MPIFMSSEEFEQCSHDVSLVAERADAVVRELMNQLETVKAQGEAASITAEQTCSLLEQKYVSLSADLNALQSQHSELNSTLELRVSDIAQLQAQNRQINISSKDGEIERLKTETVELHKSKRQLMELVEQRELEIREKNSTIKSYLDKIVNLTENAASKEARISELEAELGQSQASRARISQEKELVERHNSWLNEELKTKLDDLIQLRRIHGELEAEMSAKLSDGEKRLNETSSALKWNKDRVAELESKLASLEKELMSAKDAATTLEKQFSSEVSTLTKLVELYKENSEEWSKKAGDLEGVIKALETHLGQVENEYKEKLEKEVSARKEVEKDAHALKEKMDLCLAELETLRKTDELKLIPLGSFTSELSVDSIETNDIVEESRMIVRNVPAGVSATALAASLLRDGWSLAKLYTKYQEAVDAFRHEQLGRKQSQAVLERVLQEIEQKAGVILDERAEHERTIEAYSVLDQKLQHALSEQTNLQRLIQELKADLRRKERENASAQKEIVDLQNQVSVLLKECQDIQLRCGSIRHDFGDALMAVSAVSSQDECDAGGVSPGLTLAFKDISGLVEQNAQLRHLVHTLSEDIVSRETELKEQYERELQKLTEEATKKVSAVLARAEEQQCMIESLHTSVAMYKKLYEEAHKLRSSGSLPEESVTDEGRQNITNLVDGYLESSRNTHDKLQERVRYLEEELDKSRNELISLRSDRDKLALEAQLTQEKLERFMKDFEHQRDQQNTLIARNVEFTQLIIDYQRKVRESSDSVKSAEELSRTLTMEISLLKQEKEILINSEKRASDEVRSLSERVHRLQVSLDTIQSTEEVREEARCAERRQQELHIKQIEREWAEAKKELHEERDKVRQLTLERENGMTNSLIQAEESKKELSKALRDLAAAEARASVAEARCSDLEEKMNSIHVEASEKGGPTYTGTNEGVSNSHNAKEEIARLQEEARINHDHMLQYKSIALANEEALKQLEAAYEKSKEEADGMKKSLEDELLSLKDAVNELQGKVDLQSKEIEAAISGKEEAVATARLEVRSLKESCAAKEAEIAVLQTQISSLKDDLEKERKKSSAAQANYERQVILQSDTIQELNKTSQALADLQEEVSQLRRSNDAFKAENDELKAKWERDKTMLEVLKSDADKKYDEVNELNKVLHSRLEAMHIKFAENDRQSSGGQSSHSFLDENDGLQSVVKYLRRSKEIAETEISLLKSERLRLQTQLETALMAAETAQASLDTARKSSKSFFSEEEFKSLQLQVREISLLRESNIQLREESKQNFEECQKLRETYENARIEIESLGRSLEGKQNEVEALRKEVENLSLEKSRLKKEVDELLEKFKNVVDVEEYNHMKEAVQQMQINLREKDNQLEYVRRLLSEKQDEISHLKKEVSHCKQEISEKEARINNISQIEVSLRSDLDKYKKTFNTLKKKFDILTREKDDLSREKEVLSKQLEDAKQVKRTAGDVADEHVTKERENEKDVRIQGLEKALEKTKEDLKKERGELKIEKARRGKTQKTVSESLDAVVQQRTKLSDELEKHKHGLKLLMDEVEKLKQGEGNQRAGSTEIQFFSGTLLEDLVTKYHLAVENFKQAAQPVLAEPVRHGADSSSTLDTVSAGSTIGIIHFRVTFSIYLFFFCYWKLQ
ncbi:OLC1v1022182C1 [Oldenlandia corymbosa var. corymbosa]|uniref:OLC1v1022182C1 n=1 Tax=Oldenlandia corymbosa var. corymbosa TaxID=529605 RepID=A0AAV1BXZ3_OLDCO|nr:OLC1v1022182C1 [Oldenlandia corymbosa var. corymbosa]